MAKWDNMNTGATTYTLTSPSYSTADTITISDVDDISTITVGSGLLDDIITSPDSDFTWSNDLEIELDGNKRNLKELAQKVDRIEERLGILKVDPDLEQEWEQLKALGDQYRELEQKILEKKKVWNILKDE